MQSFMSLWRDPRPAHNSFSDCQTVCRYNCTTIGEAVASFISNSSYPSIDDEQEAEIERLVCEYFAASPNGSAIFGNYTPRGKKRRGLRTKQRRLFCVKLGNERHYFPGVVYNRRDISFTRDQVTTRCRCKGVNRANVPLKTVLWSAS